MSLGIIAALSTFGGCGNDGGETSAPDEIGTLAYVNSMCEESAGEFRFSQSLRILHEGVERTIVELVLQPVTGIGLCLEFGRNREGKILLLVGPMQRLAVSPDGERVVFEVTDDFSSTGKDSLAPEQEGIFTVRPDGSELMRIAPASRYSNFNIQSADPIYGFSPDGRRIGFTDVGPGPDGEAAQIFLLDLDTGIRTQVTRLARSDYMAGPLFLDDGSLGFLATGVGENFLFTVQPDGSELRSFGLVPDLPGGAVLPVFQITGERVPITAELPNVTPLNSFRFDTVNELFVSDGISSAQITNYHRSDTARYGTSLSLDKSRVFFSASVDLGENPMQLCQLFSASVLGGDVQQLTHFSQDHRSVEGCGALATDGCGIGLSFSDNGSTDARDGSVIFDSTCNAFGDTPYGQQVYAIRPDGTGLRQLTHTRGFIRGPNRSGTTELPGPWAYGPHL